MSANPALLERIQNRRGALTPVQSLSVRTRSQRHHGHHQLDYAISTILLMAGLTGVAYVNTQSFPGPSTSPAAYSLMLPTETSAAPTVLPRSVPETLEIPALGLTTNLMQLGKNEDGSLEVPDNYDMAGWYVHSPTPGELGPAIITGHVDSYAGPAVFFYLKDLQAGQLIHVHRQDGSTATFQVDKVALFDQANFPTDEVYGDIDHAGLRLITCGGVYNYLSGRYSHNVVVYATLTQND